jgi:prepilin-type N-terminal cleavage/methylation domain-containing protein
MKGRNMRHGATLLEMVLVLTLFAIAMAMALPGFSRMLDMMAVRGATGEAHALFGAARHTAIHRATPVTVELDTSHARIVVRTAADTVRTRDFGSVHGVHLAATRRTTVYAANGLGYGASNLTLVISRGAAADTLTISRLGRVRRNR